jgi:hypothetical protein
MAKQQEQEQPADEAPEAPQEPVEQEPVEQTNELESLRQRADTAKAGYEGRLTVALLDALQELLYERIPARFIETLPPMEGKPYVSTGIKSAQVQVDRLNAILGQAHWRVLTRYFDGGTVCKTVLVVGNNLGALQLDEHGDLVPPVAMSIEGQGLISPEVLVVRDGYGGVKNARQPGNTYKGSETNSLKRTIARLGPGSEVYNLDFEDHPESQIGDGFVAPASPMAADGIGQPASQAQRGQAPTPEQAEEGIALLLSEPHPLQQKRMAVNDAMLGLAQVPPPELRLQLLQSRKDNEREMDQIIERMQMTAAQPAAPAAVGQPPQPVQ